MINDKSEHKEVVMDFMKYLLSPEVAGQWSAETLSPSVVPGVETEMPEVIMTAIQAKEGGNIAHEGALTASFSGEYLTAWRSITQGLCADRSLTPADILDEPSLPLTKSTPANKTRGISCLMKIGDWLRTSLSPSPLLYFL